ncbi:hypothetical protein AB205_0102510 [Aquarana catesbeiana]|uniref:Uncharacterized protein n=1 Tax=Aquarana catesbeiana TaxID=8400 RepID=A0A2G9RMR5_AQUCT|nr:hypothetical protein AB205_0102510 [Aquarana catesbeiana]
MATRLPTASPYVNQRAKRGSCQTLYSSTVIQFTLLFADQLCPLSTNLNVMMENRPPLTSPDGSSNRNPPERCPRPLYSRNSTQEHQEIPQEDQVEDQVDGLIIKVEEDEMFMMGEESEEDDGHVIIKEEQIPVEIGKDESSNRNTLEGSPPLSLDSTQGKHKIQQDPQVNNFINVKAEPGSHEDKDVKGNESCMKEEGPPEISTVPGDTLEGNFKVEEDEVRCVKIEDDEIDGRYRRYNAISSTDDEIDDSSTDSPEENPTTPNLHSVLYHDSPSSDPITHEGALPNPAEITANYTSVSQNQQKS